MEAIAGTVTAATGALGPVLAKLKSLLADGLEERRGDIEFIISELEPVHSLLLRIWEREDLVPECKDWTVEARELSYDLENSIDDFVLGLAEGGGTNLFEGIKLQVQRLVSGCCEEWVSLDQTITTNRLVVDPRARFLHKDESELVEIEDKKAELTKFLEENKAVCILGFAGMGKTTLADLVYQAMRDRFECHAFVSLSPRANMEQVPTTILGQLTAHHGPSAACNEAAPAGKRIVSAQSAPTADTDMGKDQCPIESVSNFVMNRRYLVIIDDVADCKQLEVIRNTLPMNKLSRIIMSTRVDAVAKKCMMDYEAVIYKISGLSMDATAVLSQRILKRSCKDDTVPYDLHNALYCIAKMSGGMPLAVTCMSWAVAEQLPAGEEGQEHDPDTMPCDRFHVVENRLLEGLLSVPCLKPLAESLGVGYHDLPLHLKTCLLHCSVYPPYHILERDDLVRMWIAEGFVYEEEEARSYCDELVSRGLVQGCSDLVPALRYEMNPMMLQFLRCKSQEDYRIPYLDCGFGMSSLHLRRVRRLSVQNYKNRLDISTLHVSGTRSLYVFDHSWRTLFGDFGHLRVLHLHGNNLKIDDLVVICGLAYLSCLSLKGALINQLPKQLEKLKHLKTLNVSNTGILRVPGEIGELEQLETLDVSNTMVTKLPSELRRLQNLKTLDLTNSSLKELDVSNTMVSDVPREIGKLQHLKTLNVSNTMVAGIPVEIWELQHLKTLNICNTSIQEVPWELGCRWNPVLVLAGNSDAPKVIRLLEDVCEGFMDGDTSSLQANCPRNLRSVLSVALFDRFGSSLEPLAFARFKVASRHLSVPKWVKDNLRDISSLEISLWKLEEDDIKFLQAMPNLQVLALRVQVLSVKGLSITGAGFSRLDSLCIDCRAPRVTFENGAMPKLKYLEFKLYAFRPTKNPVGIKHLRSLQRVVFRSASWYKSDARGIHAVIDKVRKEAKEHRNRITLCVNAKEEDFPEKGVDKDTCEGNRTNAPGSREANGIKTNLFSDDKREDVSQVSNNRARIIQRTKTYS